RRCLAGEAMTNVEFKGSRRSGILVDLSISIAPLRNAAGTISGVMAVIADITDRKAAESNRSQLEDQLRQSQKMEAVGRLAGGVAHDFNNLLTAVSGYATILQGELEDAHPLRPHVDEILKASTRAAQLTRQLLAFSRRQVL